MSATRMWWCLRIPQNINSDENCDSSLNTCAYDIISENIVEILCAQNAFRTRARAALMQCLLYISEFGYDSKNELMLSLWPFAEMR